MLKQIKGLLYLSLLVSIWVGSSYFISAIFKSGDSSFNKPLFLTYYGTAMKVLFLIPMFVEYMGQKNQKQMDAFKKDLWETASLGFKFNIVCFCSNYFYNIGLGSTSVSSSTVLCNTSSIWVYVMGLLMLPGGKFEPMKALMVILSFAGIVVITIADTPAD